MEDGGGGWRGGGRRKQTRRNATAARWFRRPPPLRAAPLLPHTHAPCLRQTTIHAGFCSPHFLHRRWRSAARERQAREKCFLIRPTPTTPPLCANTPPTRAEKERRTHTRGHETRTVKKNTEDWGLQKDVEKKRRKKRGQPLSPPPAFHRLVPPFFLFTLPAPPPRPRQCRPAPRAGPTRPPCSPRSRTCPESL